MSINYRNFIVFLGLFLSTASITHASESCIESDYKPQTIAAIDCDKKVCFATLPCGTTKTNKEPITQLDFIPNTIQKKVFACLADSKGNCPATSQECESKKVKDSLVVTTANDQIKKLISNKSDSYGNTYQYETLSVVSLGNSGGCNKKFCVGSLSIYEMETSTNPFTTNFPVGCLQNNAGLCPNEVNCTHDKKYVIFNPKDSAVHHGDVSRRAPASSSL